MPTQPISDANTDSRFSITFVVLASTFCVCLIVSNLMESKVFDLGFLTLTAGVVVFPVSYIINDCIVEIYGFRAARFVIWLGFGMNLLATVLLQLGLLLPADPGWHGQQAMQMVFGAVPRILLASFTAFLAGSFANAYVMDRMKLTGRTTARSFSARAIVSTLWGESIDSVVFFPLAFGGVLSWNVILTLIVTQALLKTAYEIAVLPVTLRAVAWLRRREITTA